MAKQNQKQKKQETKKTKQQKQQQKNDKTQLCHYSPPWGVQSCFFGGVLGFLVSYFLVRCCFFLQWLTKPKKKQETRTTRNQKNKKQNDKTQLSATTPALGVCNLGFFCCFFLFFFCFWVFLFLVFWSMLVLFWRAKDPDLTLCQFSHFRGYKLAFGWFYYLLWACGNPQRISHTEWVALRPLQNGFL